MRAVAAYLKYKMKEQFVKFPLEIMTCMCLLLECWKSQSFSREIVTFKFSLMETFCSMEVELT